MSSRGSSIGGGAGGDAMVPLAVLLKRELSNEKIEKPNILHGQANNSKKGEDFTFLKTECQRVPGDGVTTFSVFAEDNVAFGMNGSRLWCVFSLHHYLRAKGVEWFIDRIGAGYGGG